MRVNLRSEGPVAYWRPVEGARHGMSATEQPHPGQERDALCGKRITIVKASDVDWLVPTCPDCWSRAQSLRDARC